MFWDTILQLLNHSVSLMRHLASLIQQIGRYDPC